jgi:alanyl-tRNA synthetase
MNISHLEFRKKWDQYMIKQGHKKIPNLPLPSYSDPTLLFVNSGMFPLVPYLEGQSHPEGKRIFNVQRCLRAQEFEEIGDNRHTSVFEMIGNWSLGDYFKEQQLTQWYAFLIEELKLDPKRIYASVFVGNESANRDEESIEILKKIFNKYGVSNEVAPDNVDGSQEINLSQFRIFPYGKENNWWQRGDAVGELGGPDAETFYDLQTDQDIKKWGYAHPATDSGRFIEIGNSVFMQYKKTDKGWETLKQKNVDFGGGLERLLVPLQNKIDIFSTDLYQESIKAMTQLFKMSYDPEDTSLQTRAFRIIADHLKAAVFMASDGVIPSNKEQGYVLRRAIRRVVKFAYLNFKITTSFTAPIVKKIIETYKEVDAYSDLNDKRANIIHVIEEEENKFWVMFSNGLSIIDKYLTNQEVLTGQLGFMLYETYGFPYELTLEYWEENSGKISEKFMEEFEDAKNHHSDVSRVGAEKRFKGGLADTKDVTVRYHTAAHLMLKAMQKVLGQEVHQKGQNITDQRLRFDINFKRPLTPEELKKIEDLVNQAIEKDLVVEIEQMKKTDIKSKGAEGSFMDRYGDIVNVYKMYDPKTKEVYSYEVCGGPHVTHTGEILQSGKFSIVKEESSGAGVRRIKAVFTH